MNYISKHPVWISGVSRKIPQSDDLPPHQDSIEHMDSFVPQLQPDGPAGHKSPAQRLRGVCLLLNANPLDDARNTAAIAGVMNNRHWHTTEALRHELIPASKLPNSGLLESALSIPVMPTFCAHKSSNTRRRIEVSQKHFNRRKFPRRKRKAQVKTAQVLSDIDSEAGIGN